MRRDARASGWRSTAFANGIRAGTQTVRATRHRQAQEAVLYSFQNGLDGYRPDGALIADASGTLYGLTAHGGPYGWGTAYSVSSQGSGYAESRLLTYDLQPRGGEPMGTLLAGKNGVLYGAAYTGGLLLGSSSGVIFALVPGNGVYTEQIVYNFLGLADGKSPHGGVIADASGALYGTTQAGGRRGRGVVFKLTPSGSFYNEQVLHWFRGGRSDGDEPQAGRRWMDPEPSMGPRSMAARGSAFKDAAPCSN